MPDQGNVDYLHSSLLALYGFTGVFSLRGGGVSPPPFSCLNLGRGLGDEDANVETNLKRLLKAVGVKQPHQAAQVHGNNAFICSGPGQYHAAEADILISPTGDALSVRVADCLPILITDSQSGMTAAIHAGWRGTVAHISVNAVARMTKLGANPDSMLAALGPCIGPCCFAIDDKTAQKLAGCATNVEQYVSGASPHYADLQAINARHLRQAGLAAKHIEIFKACTCCDVSRYFSHRRDGAKTGRHLAIIAKFSTGGIAEAVAAS